MNHPDKTARPMTVAGARGLGLRGVVSGECPSVTFERIGVAEDEVVPQIAARRRFVCSACGGHKITSMPDWTGYYAHIKRGQSLQDD